MRKNFGAKALLYPMPVFIIGTYNADGSPNAMNAAWGGIADSTRISICLASNHKTVENILNKKAFTVSMGTKSTIKACDYVGIVSGNDTVDKFSKAGFHAQKASVDAPIILELPLCLECTLISYDYTTSLLLGEIKNVSVDNSILDTKGKIDLSKLQAITYDPEYQKYIELGEVVGNAFCDGLELKA